MQGRIFYKFAVAGAIAASLACGIAVTPASADPPKVPAVVKWAGFYIGGDVGFGSGHSNYSFADPGNSGFFGCGPCAGPWDPQNPSASASSWVGGAHLGYNWQVSPLWLAGVEGDFTWSGIRVSSNTPLTQPSFTSPNSNVNFQTDVKWLASLRGRIGYTRDNWLAYFTGGVAWSDMNFSGSAICPVAGCGAAALQAATFSGSTTKTGFVLGGGAEWQAPNTRWRARVEYLYYRFDGTTNGSGMWDRIPSTGGTFHCGIGGASGVCSAAYGFGAVSIQTVRFGLSYALN
jgi:outer membrane immunogenic protein